MSRLQSLKLVAIAAAAALTLPLAACSDAGTDNNAESTGSGSTITVTDLSGAEVEVPKDPKSVVVTDNRSFQILEKWGIKISAAPLDLMNKNVHSEYLADDSIINLGSHREPNLEAIVEAQPDLVINGQRFDELSGDIKKLLPEGAAFVDVNKDEEMPLDEYFTTQVTLLGEIFNKQDEAKDLIDEFNGAVDRAKGAYHSDETVMGLVVSGGAVNYAAPGNGRSVGPLFPLLGLTPALDQKGSTDHEGDEVSLEAIADANPDWLIVLDRDQAVGTEDGSPYVPSDEVIKKSEALKNVTAVKEGHIVTAPGGFYTAEDIILYTEFLNEIADSFEAAH